MYNEYVASTGVKDWRRTMLDEELHTSYLKQLHLPKDMDNLFESDAKEFQKMMMMYSCAIKEVKTKLQVLNDEFSMTKNRNPIEFIKTRIKQPDSIATKLKKKGYPITVESVRQHLNDVAGVRVICAFIDDIYKVADMLSAQDDVVLIKTKDYIKKPKMNGYRSLHLIVEVPVFFSDHKENMRVEVQIRTIAMDFWATLEHHLRYKNDKEISDDIRNRLSDCAKSITDIDYEMEDIHNEVFGHHKI
mgnify:CR=1 FL=1